LLRNLFKIPSSLFFISSFSSFSFFFTFSVLGQCGSCWSFAASEAIESHWALATGELNVLSEQHILSCTVNPLNCGGTGGCGGGTAELAFSSMATTGIASEWKYPYLSWYGNNSACRYSSSKVGAVAQLNGYRTLPSNEYLPLFRAVTYLGPIAISVDASNWHLYEDGVYDGCDTANPDINHGVLLVGYGETKDGVNYWIIRNSWTPLFGEDGYIRVLRDDPPACGTDTAPKDGTACDGGPATVEVCGMCGVLFDSSYPIVRTQ
jgi:cathepsin L